jgi:hypothetical protein
VKHAVLALALLATPAQAQAQAPPPATPPPPVPAPETWLPRSNVALAGLDKITARVTPLTGRVGQTLTFGTLSIAVRNCIVRGPDQPADQAAYLDITDSRDGSKEFHGWMLLSSPSLSMLEHPVYDIRLTGCRA